MLLPQQNMPMLCSNASVQVSGRFDVNCWFQFLAPNAYNKKKAPMNLHTAVKIMCVVITVPMWRFVWMEDVNVTTANPGPAK